MVIKRLIFKYTQIKLGHKAAVVTNRSFSATMPWVAYQGAMAEPCFACFGNPHFMLLYEIPPLFSLFWPGPKACKACACAGLLLTL